MPAYTGPIPPPPGQAATDAQWQNWTAFQILLQNMRYEDERAARAVVTDRQHDQRVEVDGRAIAATDRQAKATQALADAALGESAESRAIAALAQAITSLAKTPPIPTPGPTPTPGAVEPLAAETLALVRKWAAAYGGPELPPLPAPPKPAPLNPSSTAEGPQGEQMLPPAEKPQESR